jgi:hypothetical protein
MNTPRETSDEEFIETYNELNESLINASIPLQDSTLTPSSIKTKIIDDIHDSRKDDIYKTIVLHATIIAHRIFSYATNDIESILSNSSTITSISDTNSIANGEESNSQTSDDMISLARIATISIIKDDKLLDSEGEECVTPSIVIINKKQCIMNENPIFISKICLYSITVSQ